METRHLQIFVSVYKTRSFTKAAEQLHTSQPTISEHMRNLEDRLGCRLFDRLGRSISPTPEAEILFPRAEALLDEMQKIEQSLSSSTNTVAGQLVIGASTIPGAYLLPQFAAAFKTSFPAVSFQIPINDSSRIIDDVATHRIYLGVVGTRIDSTKLRFVPFSGDELVLAAAQGVVIDKAINPADLPELEFIVREEGSGTGRTVEDFLARVGIDMEQLKIRATLGSSTAVKEAIKSGLGVGFISKRAIADELAHGSLKTISIAGLEMHRSFYIVTPAKRTLPHSYQVFSDFLQETDSRQETG